MKRLVGLIAIVICACGGSLQYDVVQDRLRDYQRALREYHRAEEEYLNLLFNLERLPQDPFLLEQKKIQMKELEQLRALLLQSRSELDMAVQQWELELMARRGVGGQKPPEIDPQSLSQGASAPAKAKADSVIQPGVYAPLPRIKAEQPPSFVPIPDSSETPAKNPLAE